jgi:hypothetical protein
MKSSRWTLKQSLLLLALGGSTFGLFGGTLGIDGGGCNYAMNADYAALYKTVGNAFITQFSNTVLNGGGADWDTFVRNPMTTFAQSTWGRWVDSHVPRDAELP